MNSNHDYECLHCNGKLFYSHDDIAKCDTCGDYFSFDEIQFAEHCDSYFDEYSDCEEWS